MLYDISAWDISDPVAGVIFAKLLADVDFPEGYAFPGGSEAVDLARQLGVALDRAAPGRIWRETVPSRRPDLAALLPAESMLQIEKNLRNLNADELRFMHRYGPRISGAPEPSELLDLFSLMGLPPAVRLAMNQVLRLLPRVSRTLHTGGAQTYAMGGYEGLTRKGGLDSLTPTELAYPKGIFHHRLLNNEALYYGREGARERRRELAYIVTQSGLEMQGDYFVMAQALTLALSQAMQRRGCEVLHSFAGGDLTSPCGMTKPADVHRVLYYRDAGITKPRVILEGVLDRMRSWKEKYKGIQVFWVLGEFRNADDWDQHEDLYRRLKGLAGQQAWFIRCRSDQGKRHGDASPSCRQFHRYHIVNTDLMWVNNQPPSEGLLGKWKQPPRPAPETAPKYRLRSEPLTVSWDNYKKVFKLDHNRRPMEYIENEFKELGEVILDHATGLTWQKSGSEDFLEYDEAESYARELNEKRFAGYTDWRLPTVDELASLLEPEEQSINLFINPIFDNINNRGAGHRIKASVRVVARGLSISMKARSTGSASAKPMMFVFVAPDNSAAPKFASRNSVVIRFAVIQL